MYSVLKSAVNTEYSVESLIVDTFPSSEITNFSVRQIPLILSEDQDCFQGISVEKYNDNSLGSVNIAVAYEKMKIRGERKDEILGENNKLESKEKSQIAAFVVKSENTEKDFTDLKKGNNMTIGGEEELQEKGRMCAYICISVFVSYFLLCECVCLYLFISV